MLCDYTERISKASIVSHLDDRISRFHFHFTHQAILIDTENQGNIQDKTSIHVSINQYQKTISWPQEFSSFETTNFTWNQEQLACTSNYERTESKFNSSSTSFADDRWVFFFFLSIDTLPHLCFIYKKEFTVKEKSTHKSVKMTNNTWMS